MYPPCHDHSKYLHRFFSFHTFLRTVNTSVKRKPVTTTLQWSASCFLTLVPWIEWETRTDLVRSDVLFLSTTRGPSEGTDWPQLVLCIFAGVLLCVKYCVLFWIPLIFKDASFIWVQPTFISPQLCIRLSTRPHDRKMVFPRNFTVCLDSVLSLHL